MARLLSIRARALQSREAIELLSNKWRVTILHLLYGGPVRSNDLKRVIPGLSAKVMTQTLRGLERDGLILRRVRENSATGPKRTRDRATKPAGASTLRQRTEANRGARSAA
jgi:DNA-binding HxlR family transcriptional regulator